MDTKTDLQQAQQPVQANQTLSDLDQLSDSELATVSAGAGPVSGVVGGVPILGPLLGGLLRGLGL